MRSSLHSLATRLAGAALATLVAAAPAAQAQDTGTLRFDEAGSLLAFTSAYGQVDVGRLGGTLLTLNGATANRPLDMYCVDLLHFVSFDLTGWNIYLTNLGGSDVSKTRQGAVFTDALDRYRKQAWLADQYATVSAPADTAGLQAAIWLQFEASLSPFTFATLDEALATFYWTSSVDAFYASSDFATYDWSRFTILTDVNAVGLGSANYTGYQEFVTLNTFSTTTAAPEPASLALLATGLAGIGIAVRRRRVGRGATDGTTGGTPA